MDACQCLFGLLLKVLREGAVTTLWEDAVTTLSGLVPQIHNLITMCLHIDLAFIFSYGVLWDCPLVQVVAVYCTLVNSFSLSVSFISCIIL